ncbi:MAG TPA: 2-hydroxyacyl-CoA dehydratase family protein [Dehalococcoidia bacterium]|nr:2-hydroxyacyl-CoA dehydratase family protein [Dehalococcoidia bacterium]
MGIIGLERFKRDRDTMQLAVQGLEQGQSPERKLTVTLVRTMIESYNRIIACAEEGRPFIASSYANAPEIFVALDLPWYTLSQIPYLPTAEPYILEEIDDAERAGLGTDMCTLIRLGINNVEAEHVPLPTAFIGLLSLCDGINMLQQSIAHNKYWRDIPVFCTDAPYLESDRSVDFHAGELRQMVAFLEEHTGREMDIDRLREVVEESNKHYELWAEYNELRRAVPCPHSAAKGAQAWSVAQNYMVGDRKGTEWLRQLVDITEQKVSQGKGSIPDERIRLFWFDVRAVWFPELTEWLKSEWGVCIVMDMTGYAPYTLIDTSSEESIFRGLAKRNLYDVPMVRHVRGTTDNLINDLVRVVKDYKIDCVVWPAHMGHKDGAASIGIMRDVCRDLGVPFLTLGLDLFDKRYTSMDEVKDRFSQFFTAMGLG